LVERDVHVSLKPTQLCIMLEHVDLLCNYPGKKIYRTIAGLIAK